MSINSRTLRRPAITFGLFAISLGLLAIDGVSADQSANDAAGTAGPRSLEETREIMGKWIETQQIIAKERNDWQLGKEVLTNRIDLIKTESSGLQEKIKQAEASVAETDKTRDELLAEDALLVAADDQLREAVTAMEVEVRRLLTVMPDPIKTKLEPLYQRIPENPDDTRVKVAERFQNVVGILNEINKANSEITVNYEVRTLADGKPSEVRAVYVGLAQAYYVSARGEGGIGMPTAEGWTWQPSKAVAPDVLKALEILQGKHTPAFVSLPVKLQ